MCVNNFGQRIDDTNISTDVIVQTKERKTEKEKEREREREEEPATRKKGRERVRK